MTSQDIRISKQFCKFCLRVLKNEQISFYREIAKQRKTEKSLNELFSEFYAFQNHGAEPDDEDLEIISLIQEYMNTENADSLPDKIISLAEKQEGTE